MYEYTETVQKFIFLKIFCSFKRLDNLMDPYEVAMPDVHEGLKDEIFCIFLTNCAQKISFISFLNPLKHISMTLKMTPLWE